jgi:hypothetical protein
MLVDPEILKAAGFDEDEVRQVQAFCDSAMKLSVFDSSVSAVRLNGQPVLVCRTIADVLDRLRPGCRLKLPRDFRRKMAKQREKIERRNNRRYR